MTVVGLVLSTVGLLGQAFFQIVLATDYKDDLDPPCERWLWRTVDDVIHDCSCFGLLLKALAFKGSGSRLASICKIHFYLLNYVVMKKISD